MDIPESVNNGRQGVDISYIVTIGRHTSLVRPGGVWIVLTYNQSRFDFLTETDEDEEVGEGGIVIPKAYWNVEEVKAVDAPSGAKNGVSNVGVPVVQHYVFVLRRTEFVAEARPE
ncbi:hypothetical protein K474DRAFT_1707342 [Panus rudis PR-1116 ss-1]|nr:hypothetical protein K474DRAFT_1707342 [Panus rudis PR-1116 ss-1]